MYSQQEKDGMAMKNATIDKFAARKEQGPNRGDRMAMRGEEKLDKANKSIDKGAAISSKIIDKRYGQDARQRAESKKKNN